MKTIPKLSDYYNKDNITVKEEIVGGKKVFIVSYVFLDSDLWKDPANFEARGITFDENGTIISWPFEKFFNLNENQFTQFKDLDFQHAFFYEKLDGSLITPIVVDGKVYFKSKKSFYSDVAKSCQKDFGDSKLYTDFIVDIMEYDYTPIFEYTSAMNRVVVDYGTKPQLVLLSIRSNVTGQYLPRHAIESYTRMYDIPLVKHYTNASIHEILIEDTDNREGYVIRLDSGQRIKVKFPSYLAKHRTLDRMTERNIAAMVVEECIDDFKVLVDVRHLPMIEGIESRVIKELEYIKSKVELLLTIWKPLTLSEIGKQWSSDIHFNCAIMVHKGNDIDTVVKKHYNSKILPTLDNEQLW